MIKTYTTSQIAKIASVHPNTVRMYEEWGLIQKPIRKPNGYRVFTDIHLKQFQLARKALQTEVLHSGLRKRIINAVKLSANYRFDEAIDLLNEYIQVAEKEIIHAREAASISKELFIESSKGGKLYKRNQAAKELGLTIDTIRNWEMNGLITVRRKENGYRIYDENDMNCLRIIRSLRCASYSLSAILRMMIKLKSNQMDASNIYNILNTPDEDESIVSACDKLVISLQNAIENASATKEIIYEIKELNNTNPPL